MEEDDGTGRGSRALVRGHGEGGLARQEDGCKSATCRELLRMMMAGAWGIGGWQSSWWGDERCT